MKIKRLLGVLLCMLLCMGLMSTMAFAADDPVITNLTATRDSETTATICGYKKAAVEIPATGDSEETDTGDTTTDPDDTTTPEESDEPKTGDDASAVLWIVLLGVSVIGACVTAVHMGKEKSTR